MTSALLQSIEAKEQLEKILLAVNEAIPGNEAIEKKLSKPVERHVYKAAATNVLSERIANLYGNPNSTDERSLLFQQSKKPGVKWITWKRYGRYGW